MQMLFLASNTSNSSKACVQKSVTKSYYARTGIEGIQTASRVVMLTSPLCQRLPKSRQTQQPTTAKPNWIEWNFTCFCLLFFVFVLFLFWKLVLAQNGRLTLNPSLMKMLQTWTVLAALPIAGWPIESSQSSPSGSSWLAIPFVNRHV